MKKSGTVRITAAALAWLLTAVWALFIFSMSAENVDKSDKTSGRAVEFVAERAVRGYGELSESEKAEVRAKLSFPIRKLAHFSEFAIFGGLFMISLWLTLSEKHSLIRCFFVSALAGGAYAALDELHQMAVPGRAPSLTDVMIDFGGAVCGAAAVLLLLYLVLKIKKKRRGV